VAQSRGASTRGREAPRWWGVAAVLHHPGETHTGEGMAGGSEQCPLRRSPSATWTRASVIGGPASKGSAAVGAFASPAMPSRLRVGLWDPPRWGPSPPWWSRHLPATPARVTIIKDYAGRYFASFVVAAERPQPELTSKAVGSDLGLASPVVTCDGEKIAPPRFCAPPCNGSGDCNGTSAGLQSWKQGQAPGGSVARQGLGQASRLSPISSAPD